MMVQTFYRSAMDRKVEISHLWDFCYILICLRKEMASLNKNGHFKNVQFSIPQNSFVKSPLKKVIVTIML